MSNKNFIYNGVDLRTATVFDLTDDKDFLAQFLLPELDISTKDQYADFIKASDQQRVLDMLQFAEEKNIQPLADQITSVFEEQLSTLFNE